MTEPMHLRVVTADAVVVDATAVKVTAEGADGSFTLLPRHIDLATALVPGLVAYVGEDGVERLVAVDRGILVKRGRAVRVATPDAVAGDDVLELQRALRSSFEELTEGERRARAALAHLETDAVRHLIGLEHDV